jgi:CheY-like chemotaxis protein
MAGDPTSNVQKLTKSIEMMLKTVLAGAGYASKQMEALLGRRLIARSDKGLESSPGSHDHVDQHTNALTPFVRNLGNEERERRGSGLAVLVVEPQASIRAVTRLALETQGYQVLEADKGATALRIMAQDTPQLVLQDLALPDMGSFGLVQWLRKLPGGGTVPVLARSENSALLAEARSRQAGFNGFLCRPCLPSYLLQTIYSFMPIREMHADMPAGLRRPGVSPETASTNAAPRSSTSRGRIVLVEPNDYQCQHLLGQLAEQGFDVISVRDGLEALKQAHSNLPDVILSDPLVPGLDGFALCLEMRQDSRLAMIPVILSPLATAMEIDMELAQAVGAAGYVSRTPDSRALIELLEMILRKKPVAAGMEIPSILPSRTFSTLE